MSIQIAEQRPPRAQFVQYDGTNAAEVAQVSGLTPEVEADGSLTLKSWFSVMGTPVPVGAYVVQGPAGVQVYAAQADFAAAWSVVA